MLAALVVSPNRQTEHVEDSLADSANVSHVGKEKIWMFVDRQDYARINRIVAQKLKDLSDVDGGDAGLLTENCVLPLHHKNLVLTPRFLDENGIRYESLVQGAGDLVYIRYGILHQVINVGLNVAEAINVGSDAWNFGNDLKMLCPCELCQLDHAETNMDVDMTVKVGIPRVRSYPCEACTKIFGTRRLLVKHQKEDHDAKHACEIFDKQFQHVQSLKRHVRAAHVTVKGSGMSSSSSMCSICSKVIKDIVRHKRERHQKLVVCPLPRMLDKLHPTRPCSA